MAAKSTVTTRPSSAPTSARPSYWFFDDRYGDHSAEYTPVDPGNTADHWPSIPARLTCDVAYASTMWAVFRRVRKNWVAPAGSYCQIIGRWSDDTVRLQIGLRDTKYPDRRGSIDGRFPGWVAQPIATREMLLSNVPVKRRPSIRPLLAFVLVVAIVAGAYFSHLLPSIGL